MKFLRNFCVLSIIVLGTIGIIASGGGGSSDTPSDDAGDSNQAINVAGTWAWSEEQIDIISGSCADIGDVDEYSITITQNDEQLTLIVNDDDDVIDSCSITGSIEENIILLTGTIQFEDGGSIQNTINLTVSEDGENLTGTLSQQSDDANFCTGTFEVNATK